MSGDTFYVDFERIRKHDGFVYFWILEDLLKPDNQGHLSVEMYHQGDCKLFRLKILSFSFYKKQMGGGTGLPYNPKNPEWTYPRPKSVNEIELKKVCSR